MCDVGGFQCGDVGSDFAPMRRLGLWDDGDGEDTVAMIIINYDDQTPHRCC